MKTILVVAAHPDDEILGCGATVSRFVSKGYKAFCLILGAGIASRYEGDDKQKISSERAVLSDATKKASSIIGFDKVYTSDFPDNAFDSIPLLKIVKAVEKIKAEVKPEIIFTHYQHDLNIDHRISFQAVLTAARPMPGETVRKILSFEVPSSTEWQQSRAFKPNTFFDVTGYLDKKLNALKTYESEMRSYPHPRSIEGVEILARYRGLCVGMMHVEAFQCIRDLQ